VRHAQYNGTASLRCEHMLTSVSCTHNQRTKCEIYLCFCIDYINKIDSVYEALATQSNYKSSQSFP